MSRPPRVPAAQYVRMSTDDQQFSIQNQQVAISLYAEKHGFEIVQTYKDIGRSGVVAHHRPGLLQLISDVVTHRARYKVILVYDVSRWGRFQDVDESAHYEFLCKRAGVAIHYCAEQFENDGRMSDAILKTLKRTMAGEYSRELGVKVYDGQKGITLKGFRAGGHAPYGLRRLAVSQDGKRRRILKLGEQKAVRTDRIVLIPGTRNEIFCIRTIFEKTVRESKTPKEIADCLNACGFKRCKGQPWGYHNVYDILKNPQYAGCACWGRTTCRLHTPVRMLPRSTWVVQPGVYIPVVSMQIYEKAQEIIENRKTYPSKHSNSDMLNGLRELLRRSKKLNSNIISSAPNLLNLKVYRRRFGSLITAYRRAGYEPPAQVIEASIRTHRGDDLRADLIRQIEQLFPNIVVSPIKGSKRVILDVAGQFKIAVQLCRPMSTEGGKLRWEMKGREDERGLVTLLCLPDQFYKRIIEFYLVPPPGGSIGDHKRFWPGNEWLSQGTKLEDLSELYRVAKRLHRQYCQFFPRVSRKRMATS
jgi:DNA invertase Pin-like site-specific DNA recombinase